MLAGILQFRVNILIPKAFSLLHCYFNSSPILLRILYYCYLKQGFYGIKKSSIEICLWGIFPHFLNYFPTNNICYSNPRNFLACVHQYVTRLLLITYIAMAGVKFGKMYQIGGQSKEKTLTLKIS